jgi:hypothetical protein
MVWLLRSGLTRARVSAAQTVAAEPTLANFRAATDAVDLPGAGLARGVARPASRSAPIAPPRGWRYAFRLGRPLDAVPVLAGLPVAGWRSRWRAVRARGPLSHPRAGWLARVQLLPVLVLRGLRRCRASR